MVLPLVVLIVILLRVLGRIGLVPLLTSTELEIVLCRIMSIVQDWLLIIVMKILIVLSDRSVVPVHVEEGV
jgi:hypothetical protein